MTVEPQAARQLRARARPRHALEPGLPSGNVGHKWLLWHGARYLDTGAIPYHLVVAGAKAQIQWVMNELAGEVGTGRLVDQTC